MKGRALYLTISLLFVLSGVAALIYQVAWFKHLSYFLGNTTYAQSIVLATFMGGLAIGAWIFGKKADQVKNPLKLFALLEIGIGLFCIAYFPLFESVKEVFISFVRSQGWSSDSNNVLLLKFVVGIVTMLIPTILMGGTLPVLVKHLTKLNPSIGKNISLLYFINSLGAVIGSLLAGFYLLESIGVRNTVYFGAVLDGSIGVFFLLIASKYSIPTKSLKGREKNKAELDKRYVGKGVYKVALVIAAISGFCTMTYEVLWLRLLIPVLGSTTYSFSLVLITFILGITLGSLGVYYFFHKIKHPLRFLAICQIGLLISIFTTIPFYDRIPFWIWKEVSSETSEGVTYAAYLFKQFSYSSLMLIVPTLFMGMSFPVVSRLAVKKRESSGESIGKVYALNTMGTVLGSLLAGILLIPFIGIKNTLDLTLLINFLLLLLIFNYLKDTKTSFKLITTVLVVMLSIYYWTNVDKEKWAYSIMTSVVTRKINRETPPKSFDSFIDQRRNDIDKILFYEEGVGGTIVVTKEGETVSLFTNGKGDAGSQGDLRTQINLAQTPMILHQNPENVFVIGFGAGTTIGNVLTHPSVKKAKVAEISPSVIKASEHFNHINQEPLSDDRLTVIKDDGISALRLSAEKYDVIISQPSNPWSAGVGNLFTEEFFGDCKKKLKKGGILAQWFNLYEMSDETLKMIVRTVLEQYQHVELWQIGSSDLLMVCSEDQIKTDLDQLKENFEKVREPLKMADVSSFKVFLSQQFLADENIEKLKTFAYSSNINRVNSENLPLLEHWAPKDYFLVRSPASFRKLDERNALEKSDIRLKKYIDKKSGLSYSDCAEIAAFHIYEGNKELALNLADRHPMIYISWAKTEINNGNYSDAIFFINRFSKFNRNSPLSFKYLAEIQMKQNNYQNALKYLDEGVKIHSKVGDLYFMRSEVHRKLGNKNNLIFNLKKSIEFDSTNFAAYNDLAAIYGQDKKYDVAISLLNTAINKGCDTEKVFYNRGSINGLTGNYQASVQDFSKVIEMNNANTKAFFLRGKGYLELGDNEKACIDLEKARSLGFQKANDLIKKHCQ